MMMMMMTMTMTMTMMIHAKPMQFSQHRANMVKLAPSRYNPGCIILAALQSVDVGLFLL